ncbi:hypothetical protein ACTXT7_006353 [Hymenolepis weldensis]
MNQQKSVENSSVNQISGEEISELQLNADSAMICITSDFVRLNLSPPICVSNEDIRRQCAEHKQEPKKKSARRKAKSIVNQVTDSIVSLKRDMKRNENSQRNSHEHIPITSRKKEKKRKQHLELVSTIVNKTKPKSKRRMQSSVPGIENKLFESRERKRTGSKKRRGSHAKKAESCSKDVPMSSVVMGKLEFDLLFLHDDPLDELSQICVDDEGHKFRLYDENRILPSRFLFQVRQQLKQNHTGAGNKISELRPIMENISEYRRFLDTRDATCRKITQLTKPLKNQNGSEEFFSIYESYLWRPNSLEGPAYGRKLPGVEKKSLNEVYLPQVLPLSDGSKSSILA